MAAKTKVSKRIVAMVALGMLTVTDIGRGDSMFDVMDPSWWFGDDDYGYRDYWHHRRAHGYRWGGPWAGWWGYPAYYGYPYALAARPQPEEEPPPKLPE